MPRPYPKEFRQDVVRVARAREDGTTLKQIAKDFGISESCLTNWMSIADRQDGDTPVALVGESGELREAKRRIRLLEQENEVLRRAAAYLSQEHRPKMMYPLVRELAAQDAPIRVPVTVTCRVLKIARAPYYRWLANPVTDADWVAAHRGNALFDAHRDDPEFGYRLLADEARDAGQDMCERTAWRLCSEHGWWSAFGKKRSNKSRPGPPAHDDLVERDFTATGANQLWLTDITEHRTGEGKLYMCAVKDVWSNRIVGYAIDSRMKARLAVRALENAVDNRARQGVDVAGCIVHSDRGSQFRSKKYLRALHRHDLAGSMGQVGSSADNAAMESWFALLQKNVLNRRTWATRDQLRLAIVTWTERTYHRRRRQARLGKLTPIEYETIMTTPATKAA
ncbi:MAG: IS3 family transposase [Actinomycetales bacterium]|uniref:IS3 family transposase n=1 Tax=Candidatus Phosphoribacter hodrii TaxID=2953743 RepID=A0A934X6L7_9MICO|nr:IS3 family transposase [Candidatus Phosphoribacter hodrii]MBL0003339.1 IS3 family transposase [Candidatus Phosphoribacter hodrii]